MEVQMNVRGTAAAGGRGLPLFANYQALGQRRISFEKKPSRFAPGVRQLTAQRCLLSTMRVRRFKKENLL